MKRLVRYVWLGALLVSLAGTRVVFAGNQRVVLESYVGARSGAFTAIRNALWQELPAGYQRDDYRVIHELRNGLPADAKQDRQYTSERFIDEVSVAGKAWTSAQFEKALKLLDAAVERARRNPIVIAQSPAAQDSMRRALLLLAMVHKRLSEEMQEKMAAARGTPAYAQYEGVFWLHVNFKEQWLAELLRTFPDVPVTRNEIGREAEVVYQEAAQKHAAGPKGWLQVQLAAPVALVTISVNERSAVFDVREPKMPGRYRILLQAPGGARGYDIEVKAGQVAELVVDWQLDALLERQEWVGLRFRSEEERKHEGAAIAHLMRGASARECVLFSVFGDQRNYVVRASVYRADGQLLRRGEVHIDGPRSREPLRKLIAFLEGASDATIENSFVPSRVTPFVAAASVVKVAGVAPRSPPANARAMPVRSRVLPATLIGVGASAVIFGGVLYYYGSQPPPADSSNQATLFGSKPAGIATGVAGLAAMGAGWWLWPRSVSSGAARVAFDVHASGASVGVMGSF